MVPYAATELDQALGADCSLLPSRAGDASETTRGWSGEDEMMELYHDILVSYCMYNGSALPPRRRSWVHRRSMNAQCRAAGEP